MFYWTKYTPEQRKTMRDRHSGYQKELAKQGISLDDIAEFQEKDVRAHKFAMWGLVGYSIGSLGLIYAILSSLEPKHYHFQKDSVTPVHSKTYVDDKTIR